MCGIVGVTGNDNAVKILVEGLQKLEYRGYDSAGIYVNDQKGNDYLVKTKGRISQLREKITPDVHGSTGIGHTRWATHGVVSVDNAHPHFSNDDRFYLVHNGVIDNFQEIKAQYLSDVPFKSQTDTEVVVQLIDKFAVEDHLDAKAAFLKALGLLEGSYAFLLMDREQPDTLFVAKNKSPLLIGVADGFNVVCSDAMAMLRETHDFLEIMDGEVVTVTPDTVHIQDAAGKTVERKPYHVDMNADETDKGTYPFYMLKEVDEQPNVMRKLAQTYLSEHGEPQIDDKLIKAMQAADRLYIVGAGTSYHAGLIGKRLFERLAHIPTEVHVSSEFAYEQPMLSDKPFFIFLTQSGETADSREVLVNVNDAGYPSLTITNVQNSTLSREASYTLLLHAGPEIAVASTKAYTAQIALEAILAKALGEVNGQIIAQNFNVRQQLGLVATGMQAIVDEKATIEALANDYLMKSPKAFYIGRGIDHAVSLEAALKLKEISYVQAEGFASGELKHGTIALIEDGTPVIGFITQAKTAGLTRSNLQETMARGANTMTIARQGLAIEGDNLVLPDVDEMLMPLLSVVPAQLLAYYTSLNKGLDVDKPRNLAKSVTVE
ncbi:glucosamine--fructose-6-phosphate aminotransferase [Levilactobacillus namurensis DSM 19117]|uniref:Glutamine--fructose-6-phosphate aminotransferase [isomerizing] n=1 Tax=Levilactobacillus namurensis DSM 19117 TaxID=1423773 RepID=A0A0R1JY30_9LACO|nr:glutamine--fructose-6-phosphate transaminase (isomerizing) [Levilactobacillus namurensis]KRK76141.1 glucosamine--fructose-6-phosphate aminotransferase [Levilactobacillus namurensis DSM 19117]PTM21906.1 glutamine--fructose-6-phosphate transaminase (isomerizing) [Lactobacillus sp. PFC-70]GEO75412.1 glutamine--fructose-6-phosphate aminotransferase [isomerizing] [Levilactobacillus namurensis]HJE44204.1 glutamine--fructose-6-phosphate transaminase (isomerizing) [Levilactobacillus namurensis]